MNRIAQALEATMLITSLLLSPSCAVLQRAAKTPSVVPFEADHFPLVEKWRTQVEVKISSTPATDGRLVAIWTHKGLQVIDGQSGEVKWSYQVSVNGQLIPPLVLEDRAIVAAGKSVDIMDAGTGDRLSELQTPTDWSLDAESMAVDSERLYVVWGSVRLVAYDLATGQLLWQADVAEMRAPPVVTVCGERRLCLLNRNRVDTYDSASGDVITKTELGQKGDVTLYPVYDGQHTLYVFLNSDQGYFLVSLDLQANWQNWSKPIPYIDYPPTVSKGTLYVPGARPRKLLALEASTGRKIWEGSFDSDILQTPVIFHDLLYVRDYSGVIHVISPNDGKKLGSLNTQPFGVAGFIGVDKFAIRPVVLNEQIMIIPSGSEVRGYTTKGD